MFSCGWLAGNGIFPEGYTGGIYDEPNYGLELEHYWVETYDEYANAVQKLISHNSKILESIIFSYEGELFDTKYCFTFDRKRSKKITFGEDPFDRYAKVSIQAFAFFEDVEIEELVYSYVTEYDCYALEKRSGLHSALERESDVLSNELDVEIFDNEYYVGYQEYCLYTVVHCNKSHNLISEDAFYAIFNSVELIEYND
jgi:hypothetical protein